MTETFLPIAEPDLSGNERRYLNECLDSGWVSSAGPFVARFAQAYARAIGVRFAVPVSSGTAALHLSLLGLGIGRGDEVIVPDLTFVASANTIVACGATPVFVDVDADTWNVDPVKIEDAITPKTKAIMVVHLYGNPADMNRIMEIAKRRNLLVIEDAAEAHGATIGMKHPESGVIQKHVGSIGQVGCFSFYGNKIITTGEGGMVVTNDEGMVQRMTILRDHGQDPGHHYFHTVVGYNYRMTNLQAAIGLAQVERLDAFVGKKRQIAQWYQQRLGNVAGLHFQQETVGGKHVYWMPTLLVQEGFALTRDELAQRLKTRGIDSRPVFTPLHALPPYRQEHAFPNASRIAAQGLSLPAGVALTEADIERVVSAITSI